MNKVTLKSWLVLASVLITSCKSKNKEYQIKDIKDDYYIIKLVELKNRKKAIHLCSAVSPDKCVNAFQVSDGQNQGVDLEFETRSLSKDDQTYIQGEFDQVLRNETYEPRCNVSSPVPPAVRHIQDTASFSGYAFLLTLSTVGSYSLASFASGGVLPFEWYILTAPYVVEGIAKCVSKLAGPRLEAHYKNRAPNELKSLIKQMSSNPVKTIAGEKHVTLKHNTVIDVLDAVKNLMNSKYGQGADASTKWYRVNPAIVNLIASEIQ